MTSAASYAMVFGGAILMAYNIYCFVTFSRFVKQRAAQSAPDAFLYVPTVLLVLFLLGYLAVGLLGKPDLVIGGILFGGSIFVFVMYKLMNRITDRVIENEQAVAALKVAEQSNRAKAAFLASISHEMRTPMNVILGLDAMALRNPDLAEQTRDQLEKIGRSGRHLLELINNILDMNSLEAQELEAKHEAFNLHDVWNQVNAIAQTLCDEKGLTYETSFGADAQRWYTGDALLIKQVVLAIVCNAVEYTDAPGTVSCTVGVASAADGLAVEWRVADTGVGMTAEFVQKLFETFQREDDSSTAAHSGIGMGLTTAKRKTDLMGGTIAVQSEKNVGSTFTVTVPLVAAEPHAKPHEHAVEGTLAGTRILVADDVAENAEIVCDLLELEGATGEHAENGQIALELFAQRPPGHFDAILMDLRMPVIDGLEATRRIRALSRADAKTIPILALSANTSARDVEHSAEAGMSAHLNKPVDSEQLYNALKYWIRTSKASNEKSDHD